MSTVLERARPAGRIEAGQAGRIALSGLGLLVLVGFSLLILVPLFFMLGASLMPASDVMGMPYRWIPQTWKWHNYLQALAGNDGNWIYLRNILNSLIVSLTIAVTTVLLSASVGYGLAKFRFKGRNAVFLAIDLLRKGYIDGLVELIPLGDLLAGGDGHRLRYHRA